MSEIGKLVISRININDNIKVGELGMVINYLPERSDFIIYFGDSDCSRYNINEKQFKTCFQIQR